MPIAVHAGEQHLAGAQADGVLGPLHGVDAGRRAATVDVDLPLQVGPPRARTEGKIAPTEDEGNE